MLDDRSAWWVHARAEQAERDAEPQVRDGAARRCCGCSTPPTRWSRPTGRASSSTWGWLPDTLLARNGRLVVVRISGFGQSGPRSTMPGLGTLAEAYSGFASITGEPDGPPMLPPVALGDESAGLFATWSLLAALYWRDARGGTGQVIDVSLYESLYSLLGPLPTLVRAPRPRAACGRARGSRSRHRATCTPPATAAGSPLSGTAPSRAVLLLEALGGAELAADPRFRTTADRQATPTIWMPWSADWVGRRTRRGGRAELGRPGVALSRVYSVAETLDDPHYAARGTLAAVADDALGYVTMQAPVPRMSRTPGRIATRARRWAATPPTCCASWASRTHEVDAGARDGAWASARTDRPDRCAHHDPRPGRRDHHPLRAVAGDHRRQQVDRPAAHHAQRHLDGGQRAASSRPPARRRASRSPTRRRGSAATLVQGMQHAQRRLDRPGADRRRGRVDGEQRRPSPPEPSRARTPPPPAAGRPAA